MEHLLLARDLGLDLELTELALCLDAGLGGAGQLDAGTRRQDIELGDVEELAAKYSDMSVDIRKFPVPTKEPVTIKKPAPVEE